MSVVQSALRHTHMPRGESMVEYQIGRSRVMIDTSYIDSRTPEKYEEDNEKVVVAAWAIIDELLERGEAI